VGARPSRLAGEEMQCVIKPLDVRSSRLSPPVGARPSRLAGEEMPCVINPLDVRSSRLAVAPPSLLGGEAIVTAIITCNITTAPLATMALTMPYQ